MHLWGVELWCCRFNRYLIIDSIIFVVVVAVCVPVFITVSAARVYTGILLGVAVIVFCKLWRFLPSHKRWVEQQACKLAVKLVAERRIAQPLARLTGLQPENPPTGRCDAVALPVYYPCAAPSSTPFCSHCSGTPVPGHDLPRISSFMDGGHLPYGDYAVPSPLPPPPPPPRAMCSPFSSSHCPSPSGPLDYSPCSLLLLPQQAAGGDTTLAYNGSPAVSHGTSVTSRASSGRRDPVVTIAGEGYTGAGLMHSLPAPSVSLSLQGAACTGLQVKPFPPHTCRSPQGSHYLRGGASHSSVFLSRGGDASLNGSNHHLCRQRSRSSSPSFSFLGERPLWQGQRSASPSRSPTPASPASHCV